MGKRQDTHGANVEPVEDSPISKDGPSNVARCSICKKPMVAKWRPFCSSRCANLDLGNWLSDGYVIAGQSADDEEDGMPDREIMKVREKE